MPAPDDQLTSASARGLGFLVLALALLIFLPAWSLAYWQGWVYWLVFAGSAVAITVYLLARDPDLVRRRLRGGPGAETAPNQKAIQGLTGFCFVAMLVVAALDHRFAWSQIPAVVAIFADLIAAAGFYGIFLTLRANTFAASTITVADGQRVISTGPYAIVRHPMYATAGVMILATPVALGSWWGVVPAVLLLGGIVARLLDEERFLVFNLQGYLAYMRQTRYRLLPGVW